MTNEEKIQYYRSKPVEELREIFNIVMLPTQNIVEVVALVFAPIVIVEIFKLLKINGKDE